VVLDVKNFRISKISKVSKDGLGVYAAFVIYTIYCNNYYYLTRDLEVRKDFKDNYNFIFNSEIDAQLLLDQAGDLFVFNGPL